MAKAGKSVISHSHSLYFFHFFYLLKKNSKNITECKYYIIPVKAKPDPLSYKTPFPLTSDMFPHASPSISFHSLKIDKSQYRWSYQTWADLGVGRGDSGHPLDSLKFCNFL